MSQERQITAAFVESIRRLLGRFRFRPAKNHWLRMILALLARIKCVMQCEDEIVFEVKTIGDELELIRDHQPLAKLTQIINDGPSQIAIYEDGHKVAVVPGDGKTYVLPLKGKGRLTALALEAGQEADVRVTTHLRCECDHAPFSYAEEPIGGNLL